MSLTHFLPVCLLVIVLSYVFSSVVICIPIVSYCVNYTDCMCYVYLKGKLTNGTLILNPKGVHS